MQPPRLDDQLCFAVYAAARRVARFYAPLLESLGLTYPQLLVMMVLWEQDDRTVSQLGERLFLDSGTLTPLLKRLERDGRIVRTRDPDDERRVRITLTPSGRALGERAGGEHHQLVCSLGWEGDAQRIASLRNALLMLVAKAP